MRSKGGLELWGGVECTVNRVGDRYIEQLGRNAHWDRPDDLDRFASLGIRAIRYPVLWEEIAPFGLASADWSRPDERLARLRELKVRPIVGLVHHGSGPIDTSLVDPAFPEKLAAYARAVAERYPWVEDWTPVNEPLTTARFSGLYGLWYPHGRDEKTFKDCLFNECRGVILAMRAIEAVNPSAKLVQTDDLGKTYSTPLLDYQAYFNNELRWLGWDLICGRVDRSHYLWKWLIERCKATPDEILWFRDNTRAPDVMGVNHYITSERFLDDDIDAYPEHHRGGNGVHRYADVEAARVLASPTGGIKPLLKECWARFGLPIAVTEAHIDARREDQLRWLAEIWRACEECIDEGIDVRGVTVWGMLGLYDWNCLLTDVRDYYESGAFDVRSGTPRPTAVAHLMRDLSAGAVPPHPVLAGKGWWQRDDRFFARPVSVRGLVFPTRPDTGANRAPILITGATGTLGRAFARICAERDLRCRVLSRAEMDIGDPDSIERAIDLHKPWAIINAAGYVRVDDAEHDAERCFRENTLGPANLAAACERHALRLVTFSSDLVFDGERDSPYVETDSTRPLNVYGESKARAEKLVLDANPDALVVRTSSFFGPWDAHNFITVALGALRRGDAFHAAGDVTVSPTYVPDLVHACIDLLIDRESGIWHLTNEGEITWADLALRAAEFAGVDASRLEIIRDQHAQLPARRPRYSALSSRRAFPLPSLDDALGRYVRDSTLQ
ncbi:dTDP-4-dehydrorhamnose reductase [Cognatilysobacter terrigena]|uniref:dTDP-4-dehydrorhamnose reductase n=1 Tax=Cognatilysobacter terrigena TaxID=2488749 RepID=UPI00105EDD3A|nr:dTDP-4-dehydrorhamnose reductase [Lysobacter terrigena]